MKRSVSLVAQLCPTLCDPMDCSMPGFTVLHQLPEFAQTNVYQFGESRGKHSVIWINLDPRPCLGFPGGTSGKELTCQYRRHKRCGFNPWVGKIPWKRA